LVRLVCRFKPFFFQTLRGLPSRPSSGSSSLSSESKPRSGPKGIAIWLSWTKTSGTLAFLGAGIPSSSISSSRIMSASSSSLSSSSFLMACIIALKLRPIPRRFQGAGRGVASSSSSIALRTLFLRRNAGVASPRVVEDGVPSSSSFRFLGVTNWFNKKRFPADSGVRSSRALDSSDVSLAASPSLLLGVCGTFSPTSPNIFLLLLGVSTGSMSNRPSTIPSRCGVGPIVVGPCGDSNSSNWSTFSEPPSSSPSFLFMGVDALALGAALGVRSTSRVALRLAVRFGGVCGAGLLESRNRSLLYSLYFCAEFRKQRAVVRYVSCHTDFGVALDVVASSFPAIVFSSELLFPHFQVLS
jgi:hypothetical protein